MPARDVAQSAAVHSSLAGRQPKPQDRRPEPLGGIECRALADLHLATSRPGCGEIVEGLACRVAMA
jgi:hypothetical protein